MQPAELIINLLQQSNVALKVSANAHVYRQHNYMKRPFAPLGCTVMAQIMPKNRQSWDIHADTGFIIRTAMEHHLCFHINIVKTRATRISKHQYIMNPLVTPKTLVIKEALDFTSALRGKVSCDHGKAAEALQKFSKLFTKIATTKSELAKGKRAMKQPPKTPQYPPSCTTSKAGQ